MNRASPETAPTDADLVGCAKNGDAEAFNQLVRRYQDRVYATCYRMCQNQADALDLTQYAFVRAYQALARFEARANFFTWLYRIAVNLALTHRRSAAGRGALSIARLDRDERESDLEPSTRSDPARDEERRELSRRLEVALSEIDPEFRVAILLRDVEGLDYSAIAEILSLPVGTVKSRIHRGRVMLRELLADYEEMNDGV